MQKRAATSKKRFWILGAGHFGQLAVKRICRAFPTAELTVVDKDSALENTGIVRDIREDGIHWLWATLEQDSDVDMIIPAIPVHVVYEWMVLSLHGYDALPVEVPDSLLRQVPHPMLGETGQVYMSHADFICPDNCPEPENKCTVTGKPRPKDLFRLLRAFDIGEFLPIVVRSHQILPGVGGLYPEDLFNVLATAQKNIQRPLFAATACRCHGVGNVFRLKKK